MAVFKRGRHWSYAFMIDGVRYRRAVPEAANKREARRIESQVRRSVHGVRRRTEAPKAPETTTSGPSTISVFIRDIYLPWAIDNKRSWQSDIYRGRTLSDYFEKRVFDDVTPMEIERFKSERLRTATGHGGTRSPNAINKELQLLSRIFSMAVDNGLAARNPCKRVRKFRTDWQRDRYLLGEEEARLMGALDARYPHLRSIVIVALNTGMRRGEILGLSWKDVDFHRSVVFVRRTKSGKPRYLPMNVALSRELIERRTALPEAEFVFEGRSGRPLVDIKHGFGSVLRRAGITDFRFHDLRHTTATRMAEAGVHIRTIAEFLGHASIQMTMRYAHATDEAKRRAAAVLERDTIGDADGRVAALHG